jgi:hypothetical protein
MILAIILAVSLRSPTRGLEEESWDNGNRGSNNAAVREETVSTVRHRGSRPDATTGTHQAQTGPARPPAHEAPIATLQQAGCAS